MKLKRVEIQGFKSFADRTVLDFDMGITAILGPNGCGKTNIVDAIRWVLGEQSAKQLRGARMEDIIFKGTTRRKPVSLAEVGLTFTNEDRGIPIEYDEVTIKRRVTRDGVSQYLLNGSLIRLKDLKDLFWDSGVSNTAYAVIELPMINQVLNENTQELRALIEEGSGIVKYKSRRREAERKLEQTDADLLRLRDLLDEIGREVRSLARQVGKARRHQRLFAEVRALDLLLAGQQQRDFARREAELQQQSGEVQMQAEADAGELAELRARLETTRPAVDEREAERRGLEDSLRAFEEELQEAERRVLVLEQRIAENERRSRETQDAIGAAQVRRAEIHGEAALLAQRLEGVAAALGRHEAELRGREEQLRVLESRYASSRQSVQEAAQLNLEFIEHDAAARTLQRELHIKQENRRERLQRLADEETVLREAAGRDAARAAELEEARELRLDRRRGMLETMAGLERERTEAMAAAETLRQELSAREARREALRSRHELLRRIKDEYRGYRQGARHVLRERAGDGRVRGSLADRLRIADGWTEAFENLFAELVDAVVVDEAATAVDIVGDLRGGDAGRASFLSGGGRVPSAPATAAPAGGRPARGLVEGEAASAPHLARVLAACWAFEDDAAAVAAAAAHAGDQPLVCLARSGLLVTSDGVVRGGSRREEEASLLGRGEKLERLEEEIAAATAEAEAWVARADGNLARLRELQAHLQDGRAELDILEEELRRLHAEGADARSRETAAVERLASLSRERGSVDGELAALLAEEAGLRGRLDESDRQRVDSATRVEDLQREAADTEQERDAARAALAELRLARSRAESEQRETGTAIAHLRDSGSELSAREERLAQETEVLAEQAAAMAAESAERRAQLAGGFQERERRRQLVQAAAESIRALHAETNAWHDRVKTIEDQRAACRDRLHAFETELATLDVRRRNLLERVEDQYKGAFRELVRAVDPAAVPEELQRDGEVFQADQAQALLADRREKLAALGPVNQLAIEEYETKKERLRFLQTQLTDVEKAKGDLEDAIQQINRTARKLFGDTFEEVRRNFIAVFQTLFEGGRAELEMIRTDDPLESQLRIVAQPKGKLVDHVGLLSGGERCLTALSLLFAVYLVKPSPFCLLDEVDGPLDDANTNRFVRMLREFSGSTQFLVVTHNKLTMETANHLFGVTMMEPGASSLVSVSFQDVAASRSDDELGKAIAGRRRELDRQAAARALLAGDDGEPQPRFTLDADAEEAAAPVAAAGPDEPAAAAPPADLLADAAAAGGGGRVIRGAFDRLRRGLQKTRNDFLGKLGAIFGGKVRLDADTLDQIEELLLSADMGVAASLRITRTIEKRLKDAGGEATLQGVLEVIRADARDILVHAQPKVRPVGWDAVAAAEAGATDAGRGGGRKKKGRAEARPAVDAAPASAPVAAAGPEVILVVGVNGTGKTTSIAKLAAHYKDEGRSVLLAAGDTFRAAAVEQLSVWADRIGVPCVRQGPGADPAAVVFDALAAAAARGHDLVIVDTAGRLHTKTNLMAELAKIARVIERRTGRHPRTLLVFDANTGQNGLAQARIFAQTIPVDGLVLAKLDGTAKGGIVVAVAEELGLPVLFVGTGETLADLAPFEVDTFLEALFADWSGVGADETAAP